MSDFQSIKLPPIAIADMFGNSLVLMPEDVATKPDASKTAAPESLPATPAPAVVADAQKPESIPVSITEPANDLTGKQLAGPPFPVLGNFKSKVLVVLTDENAVHCNDEALGFLTKVISAVGLSMDHIAILNTTGKAITYPDIKGQFVPKTTLLFGVAPGEIGLPMSFPHFQVQRWDSCTFLFTPSLAELNGTSAAQVELKKQLWTALKTIFS